MSSAEPVRLVIWDLDDTFWRGTISEGGIEYLDEHHEIVRTLASRGIMSSICSKNDHGVVEATLVERGLWETFIFPSINWEAKGPRIKALIEAVQLRPESVLLIDDNPMNRNEAEHYVPGIRTADETIIPSLLADPLFRGKDDQRLERLARYKLLERRKADEFEAASAGGGNHDFLRASDIRVTIDYNVEPHVDRVIELVNRTNQLNFTKKRLPEDMAEARAAVLWMARKFNHICGVVSVSDRYGDYGICGFFVVVRSKRQLKLIQFCFSCRILNMGVEAWVYRELGRPDLEIVGSVSGDPTDATLPLDWINAAPANDALADAGPKEFDLVRLCGSCDLRPMEHYFGSLATDVAGSFTYVRHGALVRPDHSILMRYAVDGADPALVEVAGSLNLTPEDFRSNFFDQGEGRDIYLLGLKADLRGPIYRHNATGALLPVTIGKGTGNVLAKPVEALRLKGRRGRRAYELLSAEFTHAGFTAPDLYEANLRAVVGALPQTALVVLILAETSGHAGRRLNYRNNLNKAMASVAADHENVALLLLSDFVTSPSDIIDAAHFDRMVYYRAFLHVAELARARFGPRAAPADDARAPAISKAALVA